MKTMTTKFLTRSRDDLFDMSRRLIRAIDDAFLADQKNPLIICVNGSESCGKRIVTDAALETLFPQKPAMDGRAGRDEYWRGDCNGQTIELDYIDAGYGVRSQYSAFIDWPGATPYHELPDAENQRQVTRDFLSLRDHGGMTILQNGQLADHRNHIKIEIESHTCPRVDERSALYGRERKPLRDTFAMLFENSRQWARYVRIDVSDERLMQSQKFCDAFAAFAPACAYQPQRTTPKKLRDIFFTIESEKLPKGCEPPVNVYGRDFPFPA